MMLKDDQTELANELWDAWAAKHKENVRWWTGSLPTWISLIGVLFMGVWTAAILHSQVNENTRSIQLLREQDRSQTIDNKDLLTRTTRIEAKLDVLMGVGSTPTPRGE